MFVALTAPISDKYRGRDQFQCHARSLATHANEVTQQPVRVRHRIISIQPARTTRDNLRS